MTQIFVSYAHSSSEHRQSVQQFAEHLRSAGLTVVTDVDVKSPQGPPEGWPRWMRNKIAEADWVLLYIDETYRRRYDGQEEPGKGLGATWEGCIITHELYQAATRNDKFIPLLSDGENSDLIPPELVGATRYFIPSQQDTLAESIRTYKTEAGNAEASAGETEPATSAPAARSMDEWRLWTVEQVLNVIRTLRTEECRAKLFKIMGFPEDSDGDALANSLDEFVRRFSEVSTFDIKSISLIIAKFDALRTEPGTHRDDRTSLSELQNLLFPLTVHPDIKLQVASQMSKRDGAFISEPVAQSIGAELVAAPADGRSAEFRLDDNGQISGKGLLRFVDAAVGDPDPGNLVGKILQDLAGQLSVGLDEDIEDEPDVRKRIIAWADELRLALDVHQERTNLRYYCVIRCPGTTAARSRFIELLERVRQEVPELVFFELHKSSSTKRAGEVVMQILKDRFHSEGQQ
ncbi:MAG: hypothetical protein ACI8P0_002739 [Planctomycetaceae bacterium]|jgi:hypothetical protein